MNRVRISAVIITYNEEKNIERCLKSLESVADEIVVIDSFSTDKTAEICARHQVTFIQNPFEGHIQQKNFALSKSSFEHVLSLDADEELSAELINSILKVKENWTSDAYCFNRITRYCGQWIKYSGWYPDRKTRLLDRRKGKWAGVNPHDRITMEPHAVVSFIKGNLLHYSINSVEEHIAIAEKFSRIAAKARFDAGEKSTLIKIIFRPAWKFFRNFFIRLGFLDGYYGFLIVSISAWATFLRYVRLRELWHDQSKNNQ